MAAAKVDRLSRTVSQLETHLNSAEQHVKKSGGLEKERSLCTDIRELIVGSDFSSIYKDDNRYAEQVNRAVKVTFRLINHTDQNLRSYAEESLDAMFRSLLLGFHQYRVLVCLISEISRNGPARSLVCAYTRLTHLIHFSKPNRVISYGLHVVNAIGVMLKRPEEAVQQALIQHTPSVFAAIGPRLRDQHTEKIFQVYQTAADNLDISGTSNRAAVTVISQICLYYNSILQKAFVRCLMNIRNPEEIELRSRLVGSLNTLKSIWLLVVENKHLFTPENLRMCLCSICCCLYSKQSEVVVATIELLDIVFSNPLRFMSSFDPTALGDVLVLDNRLISSDRISLPSSRQESEATSLMSSPMGSVLDISNLDSSLQPFDTPLFLPEADGSMDEDSDDTQTEADEEIIDPLMHSELYEEFNRTATPPALANNGDQDSPAKVANIPLKPPSGFCVEGSNYYVYTAVSLGKIFLLSGLKGLKNDREVRISHKILAMNCLSSIARKWDVADATVFFDNCQQPLTDVVRFVLHDDDQLCAAAISFMFAIDKWRPQFTGHVGHYVKVIGSFQPIRKRAILVAAMGEQNQLEALGILPQVFTLALSEVSSSFFLIRVACAEFLASIQWFLLNDNLKNQWQLKCMEAFFGLLFTADHKVSKAAHDALPMFVRNADLSCFTSVFETGMPEEPLVNSGLIPAVLNLSSEYRFYNDSPDYVIESNLEIVLHALSSSLAEDYEKRTVAFCRALEILLEAFPPTIYYETWGCTNKLPSTSSGFLSTVIDMCELSLMSPSSLATGLKVIGKLYAGHCEGHMITTVREQTSVDRSTLPRLPEPPVLDRILLLTLRTINMYYSLIAEHKSTISQASSSLLNRPTMSPRVSRKASPSRIADISRLLGTNVHPTKSTSFLESASISHLFSSIQGSYSNFLEGAGPEKEKKFAALLNSAMECLGCICEMLTFAQLRPLLDEILLYIKVVLEVCPETAAKLLHQMFKVVFGKNAANINLACLSSLKMKDPVPPTGDSEMYFLRYANEFTVFSTIIKRREYIANYISRELGWLKHDMLSKIHVPSSTEISSALELFEGFVTQLRHMYSSYQSIGFKKSTLGVMCELPRSGIIYSMADPKKIMLDLVLSQIEDPAAGNMELLTEMVLFLVVLARTAVLKFDHLVRIGSDLLEKTNERNAPYVLNAVRVLFLELAYVQQIDTEILYTTFQSRARELMNYNADKTLLIWLLLLHSSRDDDKSWCSLSIDFFGCFAEYSISEESDFNCSFTIATATLSSMSPSLFRPVDNFFQILQHFLENSNNTKRNWSCIAIFVFVLLNCVEEEPLLMRLESLVEQPLSWLTRKLSSIVENGIDNLCSSDSNINSFVHFLQSLIAVFKTNRYSSLKKALCENLRAIKFTSNTWKRNGKVVSQWLQLLAFAECEEPHAKQIVAESDGNSHLGRLAKLFTTSGCSNNNKRDDHESSLSKSDPPCDWTNSDEDLMISVLKEEKFCARFELYFPLISAEPIMLYRAFEAVPLPSRRGFIVNFFMQMERFLKSIPVSEEKSRAIVAECQERIDVFQDWLSLQENSSAEDVFHLLSALSIMDQIVTQQSTLCWGTIDSAKLILILQTVVENWNRMDSAAFGGLTFLLKSNNVKCSVAENSLAFLPFISDIIAKVSQEFQGMCGMKFEKFSQMPNFSVAGSGDPAFAVLAEKSGCCDVFIAELFDNCHHIVRCLQCEKVKISTQMKRFLRVLLRHPVVHSMTIVPISALKMNWELRIDLRSSPSPSIHVPLVNIHMLGNIDVLGDFSWRINWVSWVSRQQFEDYWMSLFGVLSSTPTGTEINSENTNLTEQILASSEAVSTLTDILLYSLLFPEPGNVPCGKFVTKHREKNELFYQSKAFRQLRQLSCKIGKDATPDALFTMNLERLDNTGDLYNLGQLCAMSLWTLTGDLNSSKNESPEQNKVRVSLSEYLLKTTGELDTASSVRALFENYSHWFSRGLEFLPLPLLSATVRSMVFLSDLFDETQSYEFLYNQMKVVYRGGYLSDHTDFGFVIYALLKSATVIGIDVVERTMTEADVAKQILSWVEAGLTSRFPFVRGATLHGIHYILQSMSLECLKPVFLYVSSTLISEIRDQVVSGDPIAIPDAYCALDYRNLVWSVAFRIMEEPMQVNFKNSLNKQICDAYSTPNISPRLLSIITTGAEGLILHSATYISQFLDVVTQCFKDYASMNHFFPFALRLFVACVFREEIGPRSTSAGKFVIPLEELLSLYRRCDIRDGETIAAVLPSILIRLQTEEQALTTMLDLLEEQSLYCNKKWTLSMVHEFFQRLRESKRTASLQELSRLARRKAVAMYKKGRSHAAACILLSTAEGNTLLRFHFALTLLNDDDCSSLFQDLISKYEDL